VAVGTPGGKAWLVFGVVVLMALTGFIVAAVRRGLPAWVLALAGLLVGGGALALILTARAEARRRDLVPARRFDRVLTWRNAATASTKFINALTQSATNKKMLRQPSFRLAMTG